jgi:mono/diheme cytochrome c family protein
MTWNGRGPGRLPGAVLLVVFALWGCGSTKKTPECDPETTECPGTSDAGTADAGVPDAGPVVDPSCLPPRSGERIPMRPQSTRVLATERFDNLLVRVDELCASCHKAPNAVGGFQYTSDLAGLKQHGALMALKAAQGEMPPRTQETPPETGRKAAELACAINAWLAQQSPTGEFTVDCEGTVTGGVTVERRVGETMTDLGSCIPQYTGANKATLGSDPEKDAFFAQATALPRLLSETDTDIMTFDAKKLAARGTFAIAPTYPLFADDAKKLRLVHVPAGQSIRYDEATKQFHIPPNTRFYKTFFKAVHDKNGQVSYRRIETRLIVVREPWDQSLFGTYLWNEDETVATLHDLPYRNDAPFSDRVLVYKEFEIGDKTRTYAVPGAHRCVNCHMGSEGRNFILGFSPLQLNRRSAGEAGVDPRTPVLEDELDQLRRLVSYGVITGVPASFTATTPRDDYEAFFPRLETYAEGRPGIGPEGPSREALEMQGYFIGNCAQCHNPDGFAVQSNPAIRSLDFSESGIIFGWNPCGAKESNGQNVHVRCDGDFQQDLLLKAPFSTLYRRVARDTDPRIVHMPVNVPGTDCRAAHVVSRFIASQSWVGEDRLTPEQRAAARQERLRQADLVNAICARPDDIRWITEDFTDKVPYEPRNTKWQQEIGHGDFEYLTRYAITPAHEELARTLFPTNWWLPKASCRFPTVSTPPPGTSPRFDPRDRWMVDIQGNPRQPWGELYYSTPGSTVFQGVCANCHGRAADGQSGAAKTLVQLNGARVANLVHPQFGLFGATNGVSNLELFSPLNPYGGARYLVWMAAGGTDVEFEPDFMNAWVKYGVGNAVDIDFSPRLADWTSWGANMLGATTGACDLIRVGKFGTGFNEPPPSSGNPTAIGGVRMWEAICTLDNPLTDELRSARSEDPAVKEWLNHARFNAGVMAFFYLRDELSKGPDHIYPLRTECERRFPR